MNFKRFVAASVILVIACTALYANPILGKWTAKNPQQLANDLEFTADKLILGKKDYVANARYAVSGNKVVITTDHPILKIFTCSAQADATLACTLPVLGQVIFKRPETKAK